MTALGIVALFIGEFVLLISVGGPTALGTLLMGGGIILSLSSDITALRKELEELRKELKVLKDQTSDPDS